MAEIVLGSLGDRVGARKTLGFCLILSALSMVSFGYWPNLYILCLHLLLNGAAQSQAWPSCTKILGQCFSTQQRNSLFGIWGTCTFAGGIFGTAVAVYLRATYNWQMAFFVPSIFVGFVGILVVVMLIEPPMGIPLTEIAQEALPGPHPKPSSNTLPWIKLWALPMVKEAAIATFCIKIVRYCMFMWLPLYLHQELHYSQTEAGLHSTIFEIGGVIGSASMGYLITRFLHDKAFKGTSLGILLSALSFIGFYATTGHGVFLNQSFMLLAGAFNCGVDPILTGSIPSALGEQGGMDIQASVAGFVNGIGTMGTIIEGPIIGLVAELFGWQSMIYLMIAVSLLGAMATYRGHMIQSRR
ncbi:glucose-6-phosphate exchanger SLC37A2 [Strongylocentrotus purpuratus]|uniref:Major facilitator superfamily (MFS) profile domain-containing protein n=1 Tax=Strongylocentrotus purpuratus TaxID=7668 RepID=A0A7M7PVJ6_STRPU|nr:glucose-6-phosphate exchanger SLC37A2 [Strongylocentrotus purpuratus]